MTGEGRKSMLVLVNQKSIGRNKKIKTVPLEYQDAPADVYALFAEDSKIKDPFILNQIVSGPENEILRRF